MIQALTLSAADESPSVLSRLYTGPLAEVTPPLVSPHGAPEAIDGASLLQHEYLETILNRFSTAYPQGDRRAVASLWSKWHFNALLAPALAANLLLEREMPLALEQVKVVLATESSRTARLCLAHDGTPIMSPAPFERFANLLENHLQPLIGMLAALSGAAPRVFWSNAGNTFEHYVGVLTHHPLATPGATEPAYRLLESRCTPGGQRNPLYRPVRYRPSCAGQPHRERRLCCLRYLLSEFDYCSSCPLPRGKQAPN